MQHAVRQQDSGTASQHFTIYSAPCGLANFKETWQAGATRGLLSTRSIGRYSGNNRGRSTKTQLKIHKMEVRKQDREIAKTANLLY